MKTFARKLVLWGWCFGLGSCVAERPTDRGKPPFLSASAESSSASNPKSTTASEGVAPPALEPGGYAVEELELKGFEPALVMRPRGSGSHDVLFAGHGAGGRAEYQCAYWSSILPTPMMIVCLRGTRMVRNDPQSGYYYKTHLELERELLTAVEALREKKEWASNPPPWMYGAYSQGATMGALLLVEHGDLFDRLALIEGGGEGWTRPRVERFVEAGARRILAVCGTSSCARDAEKNQRIWQAYGLDTRVHSAPGAGHTYLGRVQELVSSELTWLIGTE